MDAKLLDFKVEELSSLSSGEIVRVLLPPISAYEIDGDLRSGTDKIYYELHNVYVAGIPHTFAIQREQWNLFNSLLGLSVNRVREYYLKGEAEGRKQEFLKIKSMSFFKKIKLLF